MIARESRPDPGAAIPQTHNESIVPEAPDNGHDATPSAEFFRDCYAVLVRGKTVRRHLYFNLPAATRVMRRAHARGDRADLVLVRLVPVDARHLDAEAVTR